MPASCGAEVEALNSAARRAKPLATQIVDAAVARFGRVDILVVASGKNDVAKIADMTPERFLDVMDANVTQTWLMARAAGKQMLAQGERRQDRPDVVGARPARPSGRLHRLLRLEVGGRRHHRGARLRMGADRHHRQRDRADRVPLAADRLDVRRRRARANRRAPGFLARVPKGRLGEPDDLAGPLLFLASKASDFYTGHILYADGGYTAG